MLFSSTKFAAGFTLLAVFPSIILAAPATSPAPLRKRATLNITGRNQVDCDPNQLSGVNFNNFDSSAGCQNTPQSVAFFFDPLGTPGCLVSTFSEPDCNLGDGSNIVLDQPADNCFFASSNSGEQEFIQSFQITGC